MSTRKGRRGDRAVVVDPILLTLPWRASACTHLENRLKYRDLDDPRFWKCLHVGTAATIDKTRVFRRRRSLIKRCVHPLAPCGRGWLREAKPGERSLSADADPSSGSISPRSISPPSPTRGE